MKEIKIKVQYDGDSSYIIYKNRKIRLGLLTEYEDFRIKEVIYDPINTYVVIEEKEVIKSEEEIRKMCSNIYEGEEWQPMIDLVQSKDKEIKSLKQALKDTIESSKIIENEQKEEIERLNNIINKLERKMLNDKLYVEDISKKQPYPIEEFRIRNPYTTGSYDTCVNYLGKIKELKGSDKE